MNTLLAPMALRRIRFRISLLAGAWTVLCLASCSGTTPFKDTTPIRIATAAAPEPEAEPAPAAKQVSVRDNSVSLEDTVQFSYNKAGVLEDAISTLENIAQTLKDNTHVSKVRIDGHASEEGSTQHNRTLSSARARAVQAFLVARGVSRRRLSTKAFGESSPVADNDTESGREQNRRVEFKILKQQPTRERIETDPETGEVTVLETLSED